VAAGGAARVRYVWRMPELLRRGESPLSQILAGETTPAPPVPGAQPASHTLVPDGGLPDQPVVYFQPQIGLQLVDGAWRVVDVDWGAEVRLFDRPGGDETNDAPLVRQACDFMDAQVRRVNAYLKRLR
jgi:hypothetical protein